MTGPNDLYKYKALLIPWNARGLETLNFSGTSWHDGDTFNALVSGGLHNYSLIHIRCAGYNAPEITGTTKVAGEASANYVRSLVDTGQIVYLDSLAFTSTDEEDNFGRMLAKVTLADGRDLSQLMIDSSHAVIDNS